MQVCVVSITDFNVTVLYEFELICEFCLFGCMLLDSPRVVCAPEETWLYVHSIICVHVACCNCLK
jgi:hypothetical protein